MNACLIMLAVMVVLAVTLPFMPGPAVFCLLLLAVFIGKNSDLFQ